ncbi:MAG: histidine kinase dimerization/phospho-acceptor domain-containing protein [Pseudomonadota bacterium]|nr:histidine kinase dimerization/phospho-acceptor domain-containing protein [Pseudomonadota bacterium]
MKLQTRILLAQLPALVVILVLLVWGGRTVERLGAESQRILAQNYRSVLAAERMKESIERLDSAALFGVAGSPERAEAMVAEHAPAFEAELRVQESNVTEPGEAQISASLRSAWTDFQTVHAAYRAAPPDEARQIYFDALLPAFNRVKDEAGRVLALNQDAMVRKSDEAAASAVAARRAWLVWALAGLAGAAGLGGLLAHRLTVPLRAISKSAERVGDGQLDIQLPHTQVEELDALADAFNKMASRLRLYRKASDSELARARESAQAAIESLADPVLVLTLRGELRASNGAARRLLAIDTRTRRLDQLDPELELAVERARAAVVEIGRPVIPADFSGVVVIDSSEGERALLPHATPINDAATGELVGVTVLLQDVTRLRRLDELKGNLVQTVAHELRTPLTSLGMALHLALDERVSGPLDPKLGELIATAREDVQRLRALVEDLLDLSRIQEGRVVLRRAPVSPASLLTFVWEAVRTPADAAGVDVRLAVSPDLPPVSVDRPRMVVALTNLAINAIRHAPRDTTVWLRAVTGPEGVRFEVDDAGPGVPPAERDRIFDPFVRGAEEEGAGVGLGLYIAREVAFAHGGRLGVTDADGVGARFWMEVPR